MNNKARYSKLIIVLSIVIPVAVAILFKVRIGGYDFSFLPPIYASINGITAILLITAFIAIKNDMRKLHERIMKTCIFLSASFLIMYILYHMTSDPTPYGGDGVWGYVFFFFLVAHIFLLGAGIPPGFFFLPRGSGGEFLKDPGLS